MEKPEKNLEIHSDKPTNGTTSEQQNPVRFFDRISSFRPFQFLGDISYSLYLWHWVLLILVFTSEFFLFKNSTFFSSEHPLRIAFLIIITSIIFGYISYQFIEQPSKKIFRRRRVVYSVFTVALIFCCTLATWQITQIEKKSVLFAEKFYSAIKNDKCFGAKSIFENEENQSTCPNPYGEMNSEFAAKLPNRDPNIPSVSLMASKGQMITYYGEDEAFFEKWDGRVESGRKNGTAKWGAYARSAGDLNSENSITVIGNSHAAMYFEPFDQIAKENNLRFNLVHSSGMVEKTGMSFSSPICIPDPKNEAASFSTDDKFATLNSFYNEVLKNSKFVVIVARIDSWNYTNCSKFNLKNSVEKLNEMGITPLIFEPLPVSLKTIAQFEICQKSTSKQNCEYPKSTVKDENYVDISKELGDLKYKEIKTSDFFCDDSQQDAPCSFFVGQIETTYDGSHFSSFFSSTLKPLIEKRLSAATNGEIK